MPTQFRANFVCILLLANAAISFAVILLSFLGLMWPGDLFGDGFENNPVTLVLALLTLVLGVVQFVVYITTVVVFLMWLYRVHENLAAFGVLRNRMQYSSAWAVGSFFVPFANLIIPYRAISEVWQKSIPNYATTFSALSPPGYFAAWWGLWICANIVDNIHLRLSWREAASSDVIEVMAIVGGILGIAAALLCIKVVREIQRQQVESSKLIQTQPIFTGPPAPPQFEQPGNLGAPSFSTHE